MNDEQKSGSTKAHYCVRVYVNNKELLVPKVPENPDHKDYMSVNCGQEISLMKNDAADKMSDPSLSDSQKKCVMRKFLKGEYFDAMAIPVAIAREESYSVGKINQEREKFMLKMKEMELELNKCVLEKPAKKNETESS